MATGIYDKAKNSGFYIFDFVSRHTMSVARCLVYGDYLQKQDVGQIAWLKVTLLLMLQL